jgi:hypothetical protein
MKDFFQYRESLTEEKGELSDRERPKIGDITWDASRRVTELDSNDKWFWENIKTTKKPKMDRKELEKILSPFNIEFSNENYKEITEVLWKYLLGEKSNKTQFSSSWPGKKIHKNVYYRVGKYWDMVHVSGKGLEEDIIVHKHETWPKNKMKAVGKEFARQADSNERSI